MAATPTVAKFIRLPEELDRRIAHLSQRDYRTFNGQVCHMLQTWLEAFEPVPVASSETPPQPARQHAPEQPREPARREVPEKTRESKPRQASSERRESDPG